MPRRISRPHLIGDPDDKGSRWVRTIAGVQPPGMHDERGIDAGIAPAIARLNACGLPTAFSCSGMNRDHPNRRMMAKQGYIQFARLEADVARAVAAAARRCGLNVELKLSPVVLLRVDTGVLRDGTNLSFEVEKRVRDRAEKWRGDPNPWGPGPNEAVRRFAREHGGYIPDDEVERFWNRFAEEACAGRGGRGARRSCRDPRGRFARC
jgi:hypothetical protein